MRTWVLRLVVLFSPLSAAFACPTDELPWLELEVIPSEPVAREPARRVAVHEGGCVEVRFAQTDIRRGRYMMWIDGSELAALKDSLTRERVREFDTPTVQAALQQGEQSLRHSIVPGRDQVSAVHCGDTHRIVVREMGEAKELRWYGLFHDAERHPQIDALTSLRRFADRLDRLSEDARLNALAGVSP